MAQKGIIKNSTSADIGASELADIFQAILGGTSGILKIYNELLCTKVTDNSVQIDSGVYNLAGYIIEVAKGTTITLAVDSGTAGQSRNDIIVAEFVRNGGGAGVDNLLFKVVKGTSTSGTPADPTLTQQDINGSGVTRQEALWRVKIVGTSLSSIEAVAETMKLQRTDGGSLHPFTAMPFVGTAPIVESGSNANGSYIKFADGTMIQYLSVGFTTTNGLSEVSGAINLPVAFYDTTYRWVASQSVEHGTVAFACIVWGQKAGKTVSSFNIFGKSVGTFDAAVSVGAGIIAIGRWKA